MRLFVCKILHSVSWDSPSSDRAWTERASWQTLASSRTEGSRWLEGAASAAVAVGPLSASEAAADVVDHARAEEHEEPNETAAVDPAGAERRSTNGAEQKIAFRPSSLVFESDQSFDVCAMVEVRDCQTDDQRPSLTGVTWAADSMPRRRPWRAAPVAELQHVLAGHHETRAAAKAVAYP